MTVLVTAATGVMGPFLLRRLQEAGHHVRAVTRSPPGEVGGPTLSWERLDLTSALHLAPPAPEALIHAAPLWLLPPVLGALAQAASFCLSGRFSNPNCLRSRPCRICS